jgi:hypothetical protein
MLLCDRLVGDGKAHARALADRLGGKKRIKDLALNRWGDALAVVSDCNLDPFSHHSCPNLNLAQACLQGIDRIGQ